ncbi:hypothetical protein ACLB2K_024462 [Fragaria x ananassa]
MGHNRIGVDPELHEKPNTFWTQCHICSANFQYHRGFVNRVIRCQRCYNIFEARESGVHLESLKNQFPNHKELPKQCPQSQEPPNTFWTQCPSCSAKFRYCRDTLGLLLSCRICRKAFETHELKKDVHPGTLTLINQSSNLMEPSEQVPSNLASKSNGGCKMGNIIRFQFGDATFKPELKIITSADFSGASNYEKIDVFHGVALGKHGVEILRCESRADPELSGGHCRKYRSKRQNR